jgi:membrane protease YdiL (CAAX protease family)
VTILDYLKVLVAYPVLEEFIFRRHLMGMVASRFPAWGPHAVNAVVSAMFSLSHLLSWPWLHAAEVFVPSLVLGRLMQRTGRWPLCALAHGAMNGCYLLFVGMWGRPAWA